MAEHKVRTIEYHTLHDSGGYTDHPNPARAPVSVGHRGDQLAGRHIGAINNGRDKETTTKSHFRKKSDASP
jgi:hypothetical protein